ncbi:MAG: hypothetical protein IIA67_06300 [Planctomycetes bacterium]|nr:hypothetical protein [Planctomycetota bacterium]
MRYRRYFGLDLLPKQAGPPRHTKEKLKTLKVEDTTEISLPEEADDNSFALGKKSDAKKNDEAKTRKVTILFLSYEREGEERQEVIAVVIFPLPICCTWRKSNIAADRKALRAAVFGTP